MTKLVKQVIKECKENPELKVELRALLIEMGLVQKGTLKVKRISASELAKLDGKEILVVLK